MLPIEVCLIVTNHKKYRPKKDISSACSYINLNFAQTYLDLMFSLGQEIGNQHHTFYTSQNVSKRTFSIVNLDIMTRK